MPGSTSSGFLGTGERGDLRRLVGREVLLAIADLVDHRVLSLEANDRTRVLVALLKRMT